jgi:GNAT superfamily N-acetyltransferase
MTSAVSIEKVEPRGKSEKDFLELPFVIYKHSSHYVPWFTRSLKKIIRGQHPFFEHSEGEFFIARRKDEVIARIALLEPKKFNEYRKRRDGRFYFFETKDDLPAARELFAFAEEWARDRGLQRILGPQGFSGFTGAGILIDGFDETASMTMMNYHLPYYRELLESIGFEKYKDFYSAEIDGGTQGLPQKYRTYADLAMKRGRYESPVLKTRQDLLDVAEQIGRLYNESWGDHAEFCPMTDTEMKELIGELVSATEPSLVKIIKKGEELAGFILAFPDISRSMQRAMGRLNPYTLRDMMKEKKTTRRFLINGIGILPKYQKNGGIAILFNEITKALRDHNVQRAEMTQIAETTDMMTRSIEKLGARIYKTHRVYMKEL